MSLRHGDQSRGQQPFQNGGGLQDREARLVGDGLQAALTVYAAQDGPIGGPQRGVFRAEALVTQARHGVRAADPPDDPLPLVHAVGGGREDILDARAGRGQGVRRRGGEGALGVLPPQHRGDVVAQLSPRDGLDGLTLDQTHPDQDVTEAHLGVLLLYGQG